MKNMLVLASAFTVCLAVLLVWMDRAVANHLAENALPAREQGAVKNENKVPEITLPEVTIHPLPDKTATLNLPEVVIRQKRCTGA